VSASWSASAPLAARRAARRADRKALALLAQRLARAVEHERGIDRVGAGEHAELVAAEPVRRALAAHRGAQPLAERGQPRRRRSAQARELVGHGLHGRILQPGDGAERHRGARDAEREDERREGNSAPVRPAMNAV
jgi:hypothetical protein